VLDDDAALVLRGVTGQDIRGYTEAPEKVWGSKFKYLQPVRCGYCESSPRFNWSYQANMSELTAKLKKEKLLKGELALIQVHSRYGLGRVNEVDIVGTEGRTTISATKLRLLVGASSMSEAPKPWM
jgi:stage II sporulation protein D